MAQFAATLLMAGLGSFAGSGAGSTPRQSASPPTTMTVNASPPVSSIVSPVITVNINGGPGHIAQPSGSAGPSQHIHAEVAAQTAMSTESISPKINQELTNEVKSSMTKLFLCTIFAGIGCSLIIKLLLKMRTYEKFFQKKNYWFNWKKEIPLDELAKTPSANLVQPLITDIQKRYMQSRSVGNFSKPMNSFLDDINYEIRVLTQYTAFTKKLQSMGIGKFFGSHDAHLAQAEEGLERLTIIKNNFFNWLASVRQEETAGHEITALAPLLSQN
jgi:hypothetical protein